MKLGSVRLLKHELDRRRIVSKVRVSRKGSKSGGQQFSRGALYESVANPIYIGEVRHRKERHPGQQPPILERAFWEKTQRRLRDGAARDAKSRTKASASPLAGKLFDESGNPLYAQGAAKGNRCYRYYVSRALVRGSADHSGGGWQIPAAEMERAVVDAAKAFLDDQPAVLVALQESEIEVPDVREVLKLASELSRRLSSETESAATVIEIVEKVQLTANGIGVGLGISLSSEREGLQAKTWRVTRQVPMKTKRRGVEMRIILNGNEGMPRRADPALLKAMARARRWFEEIAAGRVRSSAEIARREALQKGYVARLMQLAFLSPNMVERALEGRTPVGLNLQMLMTRRVALPLAWSDQEALLYNRDSGRDRLIGTPHADGSAKLKERVKR